VDEHAADGGAQERDVVEAHRRLEPRQRMTAELLVDDPQLVVGLGIAERRAHEEAVELRLRQRNVPSYSIGFCVAMTRNGSTSLRVSPSTVTCCSAIASSSADCVFGIARLISSTSTTFANTGPAELEVALELVVDRQPRHIGRLEIRRALDPRRDRALDRLRDRAREHGLRGAGDVLEQRVPAAHERGDHEHDLLALAVDDRLDVVEEPIGDAAARPSSSAPTHPTSLGLESVSAAIPTGLRLRRRNRISVS
jgi:hypothetical protein